MCAVSLGSGARIGEETGGKMLFSSLTSSCGIPRAIKRSPIREMDQVLVLNTAETARVATMTVVPIGGRSEVFERVK